MLVAATIVGGVAAVHSAPDQELRVRLTVGRGPELLVAHLEHQGMVTADELFAELALLALNPESYTFDCSTLHGSLADLGVGTSVVVADPSGAILARTRLEGGVGRLDGCRFHVTVVVPPRPRYLVVVGERDPLEVDGSAARRSDGEVVLRLDAPADGG